MFSEHMFTVNKFEIHSILVFDHERIQVWTLFLLKSLQITFLTTINTNTPVETIWFIECLYVNVLVSIL